MSEKVSALSALLGTDVTTSDLLYVVDVSAGTSGSKRITVGEFITALEELFEAIPVASSIALTNATPVVIAEMATASYDGFKAIVVLTDGTNKESWTIDGVIQAASVLTTVNGGAGASVTNRGHSFDSQINGANAELRCTANGVGWTAKVVLIKVPN